MAHKTSETMKYLIGFLFALILLLNINAFSYAASSYVLPYPGAMPGNKLYPLQVLVDGIQGIVAFGDFSRFKYFLGQSDKYLVEAKTLFEYGQYPLAIKSLERSNYNFQKIYPNLINAKKNKKNIKEKNDIFVSAKMKHIEVLNKLLNEIPKEFLWKDENKEAIALSLQEEIKKAIDLRKN